MEKIAGSPYTGSSGAGVASGELEARGKTVGRLAYTWRRRARPLSLSPSLFMPSAPLATPYRPTEAAETLNEEEARRVSGFGVGRQPNRASVGRRTRVPSLRPSSFRDPDQGDARSCERGPEDPRFSALVRAGEVVALAQSHGRAEMVGKWRQTRRLRGRPREEE